MEHGDGRHRRGVPPPVVALLLGLTAAALLAVALLAGRAGPLVAHPPTVTPVVPSTSTPTPVSRVPRPSFLPAQQQQSSSGSEWGLILAALGVFVAILFVIWLARVLRRPRRIDAGRPSATGTAPVTPVVLGHPWDEPEADPSNGRTFDSRRAADEIIAVWVDLETVADSYGARRRSASTPTEFLGSVTDRFGDVELTGSGSGSGDPVASAVLLRLYQRARFDIDALSPRAARQARLAARALADRMAEPVMPVQVSARSDPDGGGR